MDKFIRMLDTLILIYQALSILLKKLVKRLN